MLPALEAMPAGVAVVAIRVISPVLARDPSGLVHMKVRIEHYDMAALPVEGTEEEIRRGKPDARAPMKPAAQGMIRVRTPVHRRVGGPPPGAIDHHGVVVR